MKETDKPYSQRTAEEFFDQYAAACGYDCCEEHRAEARKVFLSGFTAAMHFMTSVAHEIDEPEAVSEKIKKFTMNSKSSRLRCWPRCLSAALA